MLANRAIEDESTLLPLFHAALLYPRAESLKQDHMPW